MKRKKIPNLYGMKKTIKEGSNIEYALIMEGADACKPLLAILLDDFVCCRSAHRECNWHSACDSLICHDIDFHLSPRHAKTLRSKCCCSHHGNRRCFCLQAHRPFRTRNLLRGPVWSSLRIRLLSNTGKGVMHAANNVDRFLDHLRHMCIDDSCMPCLAAFPIEGEGAPQAR